MKISNDVPPMPKFILHCSKCIGYMHIVDDICCCSKCGHTEKITNVIEGWLYINSKELKSPD